jgi:peptidoglycan-associated lipoprotein
MRANSLLWTSILIASVSFAGACATNQVETKDAAPPTEFTKAEESTPSTPEPLLGLEDIYFDYDQSVIRDDQRATLGNNANAIKTRGLAKLTVQGHCDERGSDEYNLALGERRANAVKQYLVDSGVSAAVDTVSYGEGQPAVQGNDESAYRMNRRAVFVTE